MYFICIKLGGEEMDIWKIVKTNKITKKIITYSKKEKIKRDRKFRTTYHGTFIDRQKNNDKLLIVLAGYKEFLYDAVFGRIKKYLEDDIDVCVITSGMESDIVKSLCEENSWSYLSTKENDVSLVQNVAILLHPHAKMIFKLDEDIFITEGYFGHMIEAYHIACEGQYNPGVIAPLIPVNGYGYVRILDKLGLQEEYKHRFGRIKASTTIMDPIQSDPKIARFFWGEDEVVPTIDKMNELFSNQRPHVVIPCPIRFSIGAILFERELWEKMGYFRRVKGTNSLGVDEADLCNFCCSSSRPLMVTENVVVGHLSFGPQNKSMQEYFNLRQELFSL